MNCKEVAGTAICIPRMNDDCPTKKKWWQQIEILQWCTYNRNARRCLLVYLALVFKLNRNIPEWSWGFIMKICRPKSGFWPMLDNSLETEVNSLISSLSGLLSARLVPQTYKSSNTVILSCMSSVYFSTSADLFWEWERKLLFNESVSCWTCLICKSRQLYGNLHL